MYRKWGAFLVVIGLVGLCVTLFCPPLSTPGGGVPLWVALRVPARLDQLRAGMTEPQVMAALGLRGYRVGPSVASGDAKRLSEGYGLRPGMGMVLAFDCTRRPALLVSAQVTGTGRPELCGVGLLWLCVLVGVGLCVWGPRQAGSSVGGRTVTGAAPPAA